MLKKNSTLFFILFILSTNCFAQKNTFIGFHFAENRDEFKFLDSGNALSSFPYSSVELGIKIRQNLKSDFSIDSGLKWKRFNHPTGAPNDYVRADNFMIPFDFNYRLLVNKKYKIFLVPTAGTYFGYNPFQKSNRSGEGISHANPLTDDHFFYEYQSEINQNWVGGNAGISLEFTIFKEAFLKIGYYQTTSFFKIYDNETVYTRNNINSYYGTMTSYGYYQSILVDFYFPIK